MTFALWFRSRLDRFRVSVLRLGLAHTKFEPQSTQLGAWFKVPGAQTGHDFQRSPHKEPALRMSMCAARLTRRLYRMQQGRVQSELLVAARLRQAAGTACISSEEVHEKNSDCNAFCMRPASHATSVFHATSSARDQRFACDQLRMRPALHTTSSACDQRFACDQPVSVFIRDRPAG